LEQRLSRRIERIYNDIIAYYTGATLAIRVGYKYNRICLAQKRFNCLTIYVACFGKPQ